MIKARLIELPIAGLLACSLTAFAADTIAPATAAINGAPAEQLDIVTAHGDPREDALKLRLASLIDKYHLQKWLYTKHIVIDKDAWPPHSHPTLTLGTRDERFLTDDVRLASALLHEEFHWNVVLNGKRGPEESADAIEAVFPGAPAARPAGSGDRISTYGHVLVCYMEYKALASVFGDKDASALLSSEPFYTWDYATVLSAQNGPAIERLLQEDGLRY